MNSYICFDGALKLITYLRVKEKITKFTISKVMKLTLKIIFNHLLSSITLVNKL